TIVAGKVFPRHAGLGICSLPVVVEAGPLEHGEQFVIREFMRGCSDGSRQGGVVKLPIRSGDFVFGADAGFTEKVLVTIDARDLDSAGNEVAAVKRTVDYIARGRVLRRIPLKLHVSVVPGGAQIVWSWRGSRSFLVVIDADLIDDERVTHVVCATLMKGDALQIFRLEGIDGCGA